jgi:hypothetical protein
MLIFVALFLPSLQATQSGARVRQGPQQNPAASDPDKSGSDTADQNAGFTEDVVRSAFANLQRGMESHRLDLVMSVFDSQEVVDYPVLKGQFETFLARYEGIRFRYQVLQVTADKDRGYVIADIDIDVVPTDASQAPLRRSTQMRFQVKLGPKGWKIVGFKPSDFFVQ